MEGSWKAESVSACFKQLSLAGVELPSHSRVSAENISLKHFFYIIFDKMQHLKYVDTF